MDIKAVMMSKPQYKVVSEAQAAQLTELEEFWQSFSSTDELFLVTGFEYC